jgi:hypothetical protein
MGIDGSRHLFRILKFSLFAAFILLWPSLVFAQAWSGVLSSSRAINWANAGLPATLPDGETTANPWTPPVRTTVCATISSGASASTINSAIASCTPGQVVQLPCDKSITVNSATINMYGQNDVTLRGCGADRTTLYLPGSSGVSWDNGDGTDNANWTAGYGQNATSVTFSATGGITPGQTLITFSADAQTVDPGGVFTCADPGICSEEGGVPQQYQVALATAVNGTTVTISPGLYMPNWTSLTNLTVSWPRSTSYGIGLEDMTLDCTGNTNNACIGMQGTYASWVKGVRVISGQAGESQMVVNTSKNYLISNSYFTDPNIFVEGIVLNTESDGLIINNISESGAFVYIQAPGAGTVIAYNALFHGNNSPGQYYANNITVDHANGYSYLLEEGNELGNIQDDAIHGTHNFDTFFRNLAFTNDPPFEDDSSIEGISMEGYSRFENIIGNVIGCSSPTVGCNGTVSNYKETPSNNTGGSTIFNIGVKSGYTWPVIPEDPISPETAMFWGNYDTVTGAARWCGNSSDPGWSTTCGSASEVPSLINAASGFTQSLSGSGDGPYTATLSNLPCVYGNNLIVAGSVIGYDASQNGTITGTGISSGSVNCSTGAVSVTFTSTPTSPTIQYLQQTSSSSPYRNAVPSSTTLPDSFFLSANTASDCGTGLSWWKVSTNYPTNTTSKCVPFPPIGPDVAGGNDTAGYANDIPAYVAWKDLPIDTSYQTSYSITGSSWSGGTETLTVTGLPNTDNVSGEFQISGASGCNGTFMITTSNVGSISYATSSSPGSCSGGNFLYPDVRAFNESVYENDPASSSSAPTVNSFSASPTSTTLGSSTSLSWNTSNASSVSISGNNLNFSTTTASGTTSVTPNATGTLTYTLSANNTNGTTTATANITVSPAATTSTPPQSLSATPHNTSVSLSWSAPSSNGGSSITQYLVYDRFTGSSTFAQVATTSFSVTTSSVTSLTNGQSYDFEVVAQNGVGTSTASNIASSTPYTIPSVPTGVSATAGNAEATISFTPGSNGGSSILYYTVVSTPSNISASSTGSPIVVSGLSNGQAYTFTVSATNVAGTSGNSSSSNSATPSNIYPVISSFSASPNDVQPGVTSTLSWSITNASSASINQGVGSVSSSSGSYVLHPTSTTTYTLTATNTNGTSTVQATITVDGAPPSVPTSVTANTISQSEIDLSWASSTDNVGVAGYDIYQNNSFLASTTSLSYQNTGLAASTQYTYYLSAFDLAGNVSATSTSVSATTDAASGGGGGGGGGGGYYPPAAPAPSSTVSTPTVLPTSTAALESLLASLESELNSLLAEAAAKGISVSGGTSFSFTRNLTIGDRGSDVSALQDILIQAGDLHITTPTTYFGSLTASALAEYQAAHGISPASGFFGPKTRAYLGGGTVAPDTPIQAAAPALNPPAAVVTQSEPTSSSPSASSASLSFGDVGASVASLQDNLVSDGYLSSGTFTQGSFDAATERAVETFQCEEGIVCAGSYGYGFVGPETERMLEE